MSPPNNDPADGPNNDPADGPNAAPPDGPNTAPADEAPTVEAPAVGGPADSTGDSTDDREPRHVLRAAARTDMGLIRSNNQDSMFAGRRLLVVADGMGGHAAGDAASRLVVDAFAPLNDEVPPPDLTSGLVAATARGNRSIAAMVAENPELDGMGTTVTALLFDRGRAALAHVGDSRAYLYRAGMLHQLSHDDSFVQSLVDEGRITESQAHAHPQRNLLLRALTGLDMEPTISVRELRTGDRFLLCSDGLSGVVDAEPIGGALAEPDPDVAADSLIQLALMAGAPDNVTVIVADVIATGADAPPQAAPAANDPESTSPIPHLTRELPRIPLPPIPEEPAARAELLDPVDAGLDDTDLDDADLDSADLDSADLDEGLNDGLDDDRLRDELGRPFDQNDPGARRPIPPRRAAGSAAGAAAARTTARLRRRPRRTRHPRWVRVTAICVAVLVLLGTAFAGGVLWVRSQYFVGTQANLVGIFRGVNGSFFGLRFATFEETSCGDDLACTPIRVSDLQPATRHQVAAGITADSLTDARVVMSRLADKLLPLCDDAASAGAGTTCRVPR